MKYKKTLGSIALSAFLLGMTGCGSDNDPIVIDIPATSSKLDKAYVPALFYSNVPMINQTFANNTDAALETLKTEWEMFKGTLGTSYDGTDLSGYFADVDAEISAADVSIGLAVSNGTFPTDITVAHEALESVRDILSLMRKDINVDHFMDKVTTAHHDMGLVSSASSAYEAGTIELAELCTTLGIVLPTYITSWDALKGGYDETTIRGLYDLSSDKSGDMTGNIDAMTSTLATLSAELPNCNAQVAAEAKKVKPTFVKMFLGFGDFISPFKAEMIAMEKGIVSGLYCTNNPPDVESTCGGLDGVKSLITTFDGLYKDFKAQYPVIPNKLNTPGVIYWSLPFATIKDSVDSVKAIAVSAQSTEDFVEIGHEDFEEIRVAMYDLRSTYENFAFVMDRVTDYHGAMGKIAMAVGAMDYSAIATALSGAQSAMLVMKESVSTMDFAAFGFDEAWHTAQMASIDFQSQNLSNLELAISENDTTAILEYGNLVKPKFVGFFKAFGAF